MAYHILDKAGGRPILVSAGGRPLLNAADGAGTGGGTGTGTGGGGTAVPPTGGTGAFSATYPWHVMSGGTDIAVQRVIGNAPGEVPAGSRLTAVVDGAAVTVQDLAPAPPWPDGSRKAGVVSLTLPGARAAGSTANVVFGSTAGAPDTSVAKTKETIAADSNFELRFTGFDLGGDTFVLRMNDLISGASAFPYGTNPSRGLDVLDAGPERTRLRGWAFLRRASDGAIHRTLKAFLYLDALKSGAYRAVVRWVQDPIYGAFPGGTVGPTSPTRINFIVELFNNGSRVAAWGGPNDPRAKTGAGATVLNNSRFAPPAGFPAADDADFDGRRWTYGIGVAFTGGVPAGVDPARVYWPKGTDSGIALWTRRRDGTNAAAFGAGSGNVTVFPVMHSFIWSGGIGHGTDLHPVWIGPGTKPVVQPGHDRVHMFQRSRLTPPMRTDLTQDPVTGRAPRLHTPGEVYSEDIWFIPATGDDGHVSRIGWMPFAHARLLYTPQDPVLWADAFSLGVSWADFPAHHTDERAGVPPVTDYGPNVDGVTYPGYAPVNGGLSSMLNGDMNASPMLNPNARPNWDASSEFSHGYSEDYQMPNAFAHTPDWWYTLYLLTGDHVWLDSGMYNCTAAGMLFNHQHASEGFNYSPIVTGQPRGMGWAFREWSNFLQVAPASHYYRRVVSTYQTTNFTFYASRSRVSIGRSIGKIYAVYQESPYEDWGGRPWHDFMLALAWGMGLWRTNDANLRAALEVNKNFLCGWFDDQAIAGSQYFTNEYGISSNDNNNRFGRGAGHVLQSPREVIEAHAGYAPPYPAGIVGDAAPNSYVAMYLAATAVWATCGIVGPARTRRQQLVRIFGTEREISPYYGSIGLMPHYAIVPGPGAATN